LDDDQRVLDIDTNIPDETLVTEIEPAEPTKAQDDQYTYTFDKWLKEVIGGNPAAVSDWDHEKVTDDVKYQASYQSHIRQYSVTFVDENESTVLKEATMFDYGSSPIYDGATPTKVVEGGYEYTFDGWQKVNGDVTVYNNDNLPNVEGDVVYKAHYTSNPFIYNVTLNPNG
jgi:uncharacterized repeat protein (TIGR02543 family)